jgi:hypothetical protein
MGRFCHFGIATGLVESLHRLFRWIRRKVDEVYADPIFVAKDHLVRSSNVVLHGLELHDLRELFQWNSYCYKILHQRVF